MENLILKDQMLLKLNVLNKNQRIYDDIAGDVILEQVNNKSTPLYGELGYPDTMDVTLSNISHVVQNVRREDDKIVGDIFILDTPSGKVLEEGIENYVFRPRAAGTVSTDNKVTVERIFSFDAVEKSQDAFE